MPASAGSRLRVRPGVTGALAVPAQSVMLIPIAIGRFSIYDRMGGQQKDQVNLFLRWLVVSSLGQVGPAFLYI